MGNCIISPDSLDRIRREFHAYPPWCDYEHVGFDLETSKLVADNWDWVMNGGSKPFLEAKQTTPTLTPLVFFYNTFYHKLFELIPESKPLFTRKLSSQGKMLANVIKFIVHNVQEEDQELFVSSLQHLAAVHNARKIKAEWYSTMGMTLLYAMRVNSGDAWTEKLNEAWVQLYSRMMKVIIPVVVAGTMPDQLKQITKRGKSVNTWKSEPHYDRHNSTTSTSKNETKEDSTHEEKDPATGSLRFNPVQYHKSVMINMSKDELRDLKKKIIERSRLIADHSWKGETYPISLIGSSLVDWLIAHHVTHDRVTAAAIGAELFNHAGLRPCSLTSHTFTDDYTFYTFEPDNRSQLLAGTDPTPVEELEKLKEEIKNSNLVGVHTYRLVRYQHALVGAQLVDWLLSTKRAACRDKAIALGKRLYVVGLHHVNDASMPFLDEYEFYTFEHQAAPLLLVSKNNDSVIGGSITYSDATMGQAKSSEGPDSPKASLPGTLDESP